MHEEGTCCICNGSHDTTACWLLPQNAVPEKVATRIKAIEAAIACGDLVCKPRRQGGLSQPSTSVRNVGAISLDLSNYVPPVVSSIATISKEPIGDNKAQTSFGTFLDSGSLGDDDVEEIRASMRCEEADNPYLHNMRYDRHM